MTDRNPRTKGTTTTTHTPLLMFVYIWSGQWEMFWRPGGHGYTACKCEAGIWPYSEAAHWTLRQANQTDTCCTRIRNMTTTHTPLTQDEINEWHKIADGMPKAQEATRRLIAEVERLRADRDELKNGWAYANECLATATKEVEELRKDKERLDACLLGKKIRVQVHERYCTFSHEHKWKELLSREQIDAAMQQKGEE